MTYFLGTIIPTGVSGLRSIITAPIISRQTRAADNCHKQGRGDWGYIGIYTPQISLPYRFLCGYWLLFFFLFDLQDKFDIVPVCALARVSFTYLPQQLYPPPNEIPAWLRPWSQTRIGSVGDVNWSVAVSSPPVLPTLTVRAVQETRSMSVMK